ncbi:MAG: hypothetical protein ACYC2K_14850 [Gemmatimonadales bacterium]
METFADSIGAFGSTVFRVAAVTFLLLNGAAIAAVVLTRNRELVNRWTGRVLAANLLLLGVGLGTPAVTYCFKMVVQAVSSAQPSQALNREPLD